MRKILCVFGTRPEAIKMAPVIEQFRVHSSPASPSEAGRAKFRVKVCVTAQHRHLLDDVLKTFNIKPDYDLNIMTENQSLFDITAKVISRMETVLEKARPDMVLVHGDTTTTFAAALAAFYKKIPIGHVEAGLRTHNKFNPYPEEINRLLTDSICDIHFCPTATAKKALLSENINPKNVFITGNTVIDALHMILKKKHNFQNPVLKKVFTTYHLPLTTRLILVTAHRRENFGKPIENICRAIKRVVSSHPDVKIVYPVHPNPNINIPVRKILGKTKNVFLTSPLSYTDFSNLMKKSYLILTDSGGLQEEAPALGKPVLVMRCVTERPEGVAAGTVKVIGVSENGIFREVSKLLENRKSASADKKMAALRRMNPYGDGHAAARTVGFIEYYFGLRNKKPAEFK